MLQLEAAQRQPTSDLLDLQQRRHLCLYDAMPLRHPRHRHGPRHGTASRRHHHHRRPRRRILVCQEPPAVGRLPSSHQRRHLPSDIRQKRLLSADPHHHRGRWRNRHLRCATRCRSGTHPRLQRQRYRYRPKCQRQLHRQHMGTLSGQLGMDLRRRRTSHFIGAKPHCYL